MKQLEVVGTDLSKLFDDFMVDAVSREKADTAANIGGKIIKIYQINLARDIFEAAYPNRIKAQKQKRLAAA